MCHESIQIWPNRNNLSQQLILNWTVSTDCHHTNIYTIQYLTLSTALFHLLYLLATILWNGNSAQCLCACALHRIYEQFIRAHKIICGILLKIQYRKMTIPTHTHIQSLEYARWNEIYTELWNAQHQFDSSFQSQRSTVTYYLFIMTTGMLWRLFVRWNEWIIGFKAQKFKVFSNERYAVKINKENLFKEMDFLQ